MHKIDWDKYLSESRMRKSTAQQDLRNPFESDFGRVAFSSALRRMHDKTQVIPLTNGDSIHTRLTHSIEVMNIAHSLGIYLCRDSRFRELYGETESMQLEQKICPILRTAAIIHDIGNPPFGHFGEEVIQEYFKTSDAGLENNFDFSQFDGNAQGFRIITKLMYTGDRYGLNLTYATLGAYLKYPNTESKKKDNYIGNKKHGVFSSEKDVLEQVAENCNLKKNDGVIKRHPLSFLVEAADTICYRTMDIEDGFNLHWFRMSDIISFLESKNKDILNIIGLSKDKFDNLNANNQIIALRVALINYFVKTAINEYFTNLKGIDEGEYNKELLDGDENKISDILGDFTKSRIFMRKEVEMAELTGSAVISGLFDLLFKLMKHDNNNFRNRLKSVLSKSAMRLSFHANCVPDEEYHRFKAEDIIKFDFSPLDISEKYRILLDFISGMTDWYAVDLYQQLSGQKL